MNYQREICEKIEAILAANADLTAGGASVVVEDKGDAETAVRVALSKLGVLVLIATTGHSRDVDSGASTFGDIALEITVFENPKTNRANRPDALTVTGAAEIVAKALHWQSVTFSDESTSQLVYVDMARADADEGDARMIVRFTSSKSLDPEDEVTWDDGSGTVKTKTVVRGGTNAYEEDRQGNTKVVGTRDLHWEISLTCSVASTFSETRLPAIGSTFTYGGRTYVTDSAQLVDSGEDTSTVTLSGRTI